MIRIACLCMYDIYTCFVAREKGNKWSSLILLGDAMCYIRYKTIYIKGGCGWSTYCTHNAEPLLQVWCGQCIARIHRSHETSEKCDCNCNNFWQGNNCTQYINTFIIAQILLIRYSVPLVLQTRGNTESNSYYFPVSVW